MDDIKIYTGDNLGGLIRFNFIPVSDIESIPDAINSKVLTEVTLKAGKRWYSGFGTLGTIGFTEPSAKNPNGELYAPAFTAMVPKDSEENTDLFNIMRNPKFVIDIVDSNGLRKLVGSLEEGLFFSRTLTTQTDMAGRNQYAISFYGDTTHPAYTYDI